MGLCQYKNIFGEPKKGFHSYRLFNIAILDVLGTLLIAWGIAVWFNYTYWKVCAVAFILAILLHRLFCVNTTINKMIFGQL
jgi:hypothetical protein